MIVISLVLSVAGYFAAPWIIQQMGATPAVYAQAVGYLQISFVGLIFLFGFFIFQSLMRGVGDADTPLYIIGGTVVLNFFLDPLLIFGYGFVPAYGVAGAAIATIITQ